MLIDIFDEYSDSGLYNVKYHELDYRLEDIR